MANGPGGRIHRRRLLPAAAAGLALVAGSCAAAAPEAVPDPPGSPDAAPPPATAPPAPAATAAPGPSTTTTTVPPWTGTTPPPPTGAGLPAGSCTPPVEQPSLPWPTELAGALADVEASGGSTGVAVWIDGVGQLSSSGGTTPLIPASNQKLLVAFAAHELLPQDESLVTTVVATGPVVGGVVQGDLVLVGGGDPTLTSHGVVSLDALAAQVAARGISRATGGVVVDESRHDTVRVPPGWVDGLWQTAAGPLSALFVDRNRGRGDPASYLDPTPANGAAFATALQEAGVAVPDGAAVRAEPGGGPVSGPVSGDEVARVASPTIAQLTAGMLTSSDNLTAEVLLRELGLRVRGVGSTEAGLAVAHDLAAALCVGLDGRDADGSGLSRDDARSPASWVRLLRVARTRPWWPAFEATLPVAGQTGTLAGRLGGPLTAGRVRAKTGQTRASRALSGTLTTGSGRTVVFSVVVNDLRPSSATSIDGLVTALAGLR